MTLTRKARGSGRKSKKGGSLLNGVVGALKTALPSIVLYEALRAQGKRKHGKKGGAKKTHKKRHAKKHHKKRHTKKHHKKSHKKRMHKKRTHHRRRR